MKILTLMMVLVILFSSPFVVTVSGAPDIIVTDEDGIAYEYGSTGNFISWYAWSNVQLTDYCIFNGSQLWSSGFIGQNSIRLTVYVDGWSVGNHQLQIVVNNSLNQKAADTCLLVVTPPQSTVTVYIPTVSITITGVELFLFHMTLFITITLVIVSKIRSRENKKS